jgi:large subunit ribosomal protein L18e
MTGSKNPIIKHNIVFLEKQSRKNKAQIWKAASILLSRTSRNRVVVNVGHLSKMEASAVFVPGKVLGSGLISRKLSVGAYSFSSAARKKITEAGGTALDVQEFLKKHPDGSGVILVN